MMRKAMIIKDIRPVIPRQNSPGRVIRLTRNILSAIGQLSALQMNCIVSIADALQPCLANDVDRCQARGEIIIPIPFSAVGEGRDRRRMLKDLSGLLDVKVRYALPISGIDSDVTTVLVSSVIRHEGRFMVTIPQAALPIYLYLGRSVGFAQVERDIFLRLPSVNQKRLHLLLCNIIDAKSLCGTLVMSPAQLAAELGLPSSYKFPQLRQNVILPYIHSLKTMGSRISVKDIYDSDLTDKVGRHPITSIKLIAGPSQPSHGAKEAYTIVYSFISKYIRHFADAKMSALAVCDKLEAQGLTEDFATKTNKYLATHKDAVARHTANVMRTILREDYGIAV